MPRIHAQPARQSFEGEAAGFSLVLRALTAVSLASRWLPLATAVLDMVVDVVPGPLDAQRRRMVALWSNPALDRYVHTYLLVEDDSEAGPVSERGYGRGGGEAVPGVVNEGSISAVKDCVSRCDQSDGAPIVIFVSKMVAVKKSELPPPQGDDAAVEGASEDEALVAFARIFSGTVRPDSALWVLGPKYHPLRRGSQAHIRALPEGSLPLGLFMMMGSSLHPVPEVPAGNLLAISGLGSVVHKSATLSSTPACPALSSMTLQVTRELCRGEEEGSGI
jgi:translation elongation factor EF-G